MADDELQPPKANGFAQGKSNSSLVLVTSDDGEFRCMNHQNVQSKSHYKSPYIAHQLSVFYALAINRVYKVVRF
jgi:hypothetical protein